MAKHGARSLLVLILLLPLAIIVQAQRRIDDGRQVRAVPPAAPSLPARPAAPKPPSAEDFDAIVKPFLTENCIRCHAAFLEDVRAITAHERRGDVNCLRCHAGVGHGARR